MLFAAGVGIIIVSRIDALIPAAFPGTTKTMSRASPMPTGIKHTVLLWFNPFGQIKLPLDPSVCLHRGFNISDCSVVFDRKQLRDANAVIFSLYDFTRDTIQTLTQTTPEQVFISLDVESPVAPYRLDMATIHSHIKFNLTMSYTRDADIYFPYGHVIPRSAMTSASSFMFDFETDCWSLKQTNLPLAACIISNTHDSGRREQRYSELKREIAIDRYGKGSRYMPPDTKTLVTTLARYKFYLAFENADQPDYITEKTFFNALFVGTIPVVAGAPRADYERVIPPTSFIHIDDFQTMHDLAIYMQRVAANKTLYASYFAWRRDFVVLPALLPRREDAWITAACTVCSYLKSPYNYMTPILRHLVTLQQTDILSDDAPMPLIHRIRSYFHRN